MSEKNYLVTLYCYGGIQSGLFSYEDALKFIEQEKKNPNVLRIDGPNEVSTYGEEYEGTY